jgi:hypothetical protein
MGKTVKSKNKGGKGRVDTHPAVAASKVAADVKSSKNTDAQLASASVKTSTTEKVAKGKASKTCAGSSTTASTSTSASTSSSNQDGIKGSSNGHSVSAITAAALARRFDDLDEATLIKTVTLRPAERLSIVLPLGTLNDTLHMISTRQILLTTWLINAALTY